MAKCVRVQVYEWDKRAVCHLAVDCLLRERCAEAAARVCVCRDAVAIRPFNYIICEQFRWPFPVLVSYPLLRIEDKNIREGCVCAFLWCSLSYIEVVLCIRPPSPMSSVRPPSSS